MEEGRDRSARFKEPVLSGKSNPCQSGNAPISSMMGERSRSNEVPDKECDRRTGWEDNIRNGRYGEESQNFTIVL